MPIFELTLTLFLIINPFGNIKQLLAFLHGIAAPRSRYIIIRELVIAFITMVSFNFLGERFFDILSISKIAVFLTSGIILFISAMKILFSTNNQLPHIPGEDPFIVPIAIPMIASPALLATVMLYADTEAYISPMLISITLASALSGIIFLFSRNLLSIVGNSGLIAFERLMGMVLILISVQRFMEGVLLLTSVYK